MFACLCYLIDDLFCVLIVVCLCWTCVSAVWLLAVIVGVLLVLFELIGVLTFPRFNLFVLIFGLLLLMQQVVS